ncbi:MAG: HupE/UreJ family protein [Bacteroidota bacterium]
MKKILFSLLSLVLMLVPQLADAHVDNTMLKLSGTEVGWIYLTLGYEHILPLGLDHILFVLCLFLLSTDLKKIIWQATAFTVAHSITLGLAIYGVFTPPAHIVEPVIALSIFFVAVENILSDQLKPSRIILVALFGLIHGMGFASVLADLGLPANRFLTALVMFNVGVELGQLTVILLAWFLVAKWFRHKPWYRARVVIPASAVIAVIAAYWTIERAFF